MRISLFTSNHAALPGFDQFWPAQAMKIYSCAHLVLFPGLLCAGWLLGSKSHRLRQALLDWQWLTVQAGCQQFAAQRRKRQPARAHAGANPDL